MVPEGVRPEGEGGDEVNVDLANPGVDLQRQRRAALSEGNLEGRKTAILENGFSFAGKVTDRMR